MQQEFKYLLTAVMYFTRIPGIRNAPWDRASLQQALKYFPLIGWLVGAVMAGLLLLAQSVLPDTVAVMVALIAAILLTGAMHEDGLADSCDAFGGGWDAEQVLAIMKDPRIGTYGVLSLVAVVGLKFLLLIELVALDVAATALLILCAHALSRFVVLLLPSALDYVQQSPASKSQPMVGERFPRASLYCAAVIALLPILILGNVQLWAAAGVAVLVAVGLGIYFNRRIGGYSGDCLGATQQCSETMIYLTMLVLWTST